MQKEDELIAHSTISRFVWLAMRERKCLLRYNDVPCRAVLWLLDDQFRC